MDGGKLTQFSLANLNRFGILLPKKMYVAQKFFCIFIGLLLSFLIILSFMQYFYINSILDFVDNTECLAGFCQFFCKAVLCVYHKEKFRNLMRISKCFWNKESCSKPVKHEIDSLQKNVIIIQKFYFYSVVVFLLPLFILTALRVGKLPSGSWNMENDGAFYKCAFIPNAVILAATAYFVSNFDGLFLGFIYETIIQLKIFCNSLENLSVRDVSTEEDFGDYYEQLRNHLRHHNFLLQFIKKIQNLYSVIFMIQYVTVAPIICTEMYFSFSERSGGTALTVRYGLGCICFIGQLSLYCVPTNFLSDETTAVAISIYNSDWFSKHFRKLRTPILLLIQASQNDLKFMACGLVAININTLLSVVKVSFSASAVLKSLNE